MSGYSGSEHAQVAHWRAYYNLSAGKTFWAKIDARAAESPDCPTANDSIIDRAQDIQ